MLKITYYMSQNSKKYLIIRRKNAEIYQKSLKNKLLIRRDLSEKSTLGAWGGDLASFFLVFGGQKHNIIEALYSQKIATIIGTI